MAMADAAFVAIDWAIIAIVVGVVEEPIDYASFAGSDGRFETRDSNNSVPSNEGQPNKVVAEVLSKPPVMEPEFAEPDRRRRRGGYGVTLVVAVLAMAVNESFEEAPEEGVSSIYPIP